MSSYPPRIIRAGFDYQETFLLSLKTSTSNGGENLSSATAILVSVKNKNKTVELIADQTQSSGDTGASWGDGLVTVSIPASATTGLDAQEGWMEFAVKIGGKRLTYPDVPVVIEKGFALA